MVDLVLLPWILHYSAAQIAEIVSRPVSGPKNQTNVTDNTAFDTVWYFS